MGAIKTLGKRISLIGTALVLAGTSLAFFVPARKAGADPTCQNGGVYVLFARGSNAPFYSNEAVTFLNTVTNELAVRGVATPGWSELGNLDNDGDSGWGWGGVDTFEYPAVDIDWYSSTPLTDYNNSVRTGVQELLTHLSDRVNKCPTESIVLGGFSQGANVIADALPSMNANILDHLGYIALYGDPTFSKLCGQTAWWRKVANNNCTGGVAGSREPYAQGNIQTRHGNWCDPGDGICNVISLNALGNHTTVYNNTWIPNSAPLIASAAKARSNYLTSLSPAPTTAPTPLPNTLTLTQGISRNPSGTVRAYEPFSWSYTVQNTSGSSASIQRLVVAVRGPGGSVLDVPCEGGAGVALAANQTFTCNASLPTGYGQAGTYTLWADWLGYDGSWHQGQLGGNQTMTLSAPYQISAAQPVSVGPTNNVTMYTPLQWSYRMRNTSGSPISIERAIVAVRGPSGNALDVTCQNGNGIALQPDEEWTCAATLPTGYGQSGTYTFWADWMDYNGVWHQGQLGANKTLTLTPAPTLTIVQPISVGPSNYRPMLTPLWWSYRVKNTSGAWASIQRLSVPVRGPAGDALDVQCVNGTGVTLAPAEEWTCEAYLPTGYGSTGTFTFWADWLGYDGSWHAGQLGGSSPLTLY